MGGAAADRQGAAAYGPYARFVFPAERGTVETTADANCPLLTLKTTGGFEVAFGHFFFAVRANGIGPDPLW